MSSQSGQGVPEVLRALFKIIAASRRDGGEAEENGLAAEDRISAAQRDRSLDSRRMRTGFRVQRMCAPRNDEGPT